MHYIRYKYVELKLMMEAQGYYNQYTMSSALCYNDCCDGCIILFQSVHYVYNND